MMPMRRIVHQLWVAAVAWTVVAVFAYLRVPLQALSVGRPIPPLSGVLDPLIGCWVWALLTPPILWLAERFPIDLETWRRNGLLHAAAAAASVTVSAPATLMLLDLFEVAGRPATLQHQIIGEAFIDLFSYAGLVALGHALTYYRVSTEEKLRRSELEARLLSARVEALEARMHPHFLFNALNTVSSLVRIGDTKAAVRAVARLGDLLRTLLLDDGQEVPLAQELEFVGRYLELEQARFGERLSSRIDAEPAVMSALVPRLVLQPLVENALRHGIEPSADPGRVEVRAVRSGETLEMEVRDTGARGGSSTPSTRVGLANTRARLEQLYGARQELRLTTNAEGTVARVVIPFHAAAASRPQ
jgi:hypothetical protein